MRLDRKIDAKAERNVVVGQFGTVMSAPVPMQSANAAKAALDAEKYGPNRRWRHHLPRPVFAAIRRFH